MYLAVYDGERNTWKFYDKKLAFNIWEKPKIKFVFISALLLVLGGGGYVSVV
jgi:hypothetical protein